MRRAATVLLIVAAVIWCSQAVRKAGRASGNDLTGYLEASRALYDGGDPYHLPDRFPYIYPLLLAAVIRPLAALPRDAASVIWFVMQAGSLWWVLSVVMGSLPPKGGSHGTARMRSLPPEGGSSGIHSVASAFRRKEFPLIAALVIAVFGDVLQNEFLNGQVNLIVLALIATSIHLGQRHPRWAAALLGCAIALKLTPALFLMYWFIERRYRMAGESMLWAAALILSPWLVVRDRLWPMYGSYVHEFILARTATIETHAEALFFTPYGCWSWLTGSTPGRAAIVATSAIIGGALIVWHARIRGRGAAATTGTAWVYAAATPLFSPMSEVHHLTMLIPAGTITALGAWTRDSRLVTLCAAAFAVLIWIGRFDRQGPWYFFSIVAILISAAAICEREGVRR